LECPAADQTKLVSRGDMLHHVGVGDIFVIAGQSNASGRGKDPVYDPPELGVHMLRNSGRWDIAAHPLNESTDMIYEAHLENYNPATVPTCALQKCSETELHYPIGLIQTALGGSGLWQWNPDEEGSLYRNMIHIIKSTAVRIKGILGTRAVQMALKLGATYFERF
jgi:hypothetical protein